MIKLDWRALSAAGLASAALGAWLKRRHRISFEGRTVIITGGSRGLGLCMARRLVREGARLALLARAPAELDRAREELGDDVMTVPCDVGSREQVEEAVRQVVERFGGVDVLINNAGVIQVGPFEHMDESDFEDALDAHLRGPLYGMWAVLPHMLARGEGRIVNISSIGGRVAVPHLVPYCASKFALTGMSNAVRPELARHNIRVTTVHPWLMRTGSPINALFKGQHEKEFTWFAISAALPLLTVSAERAARRIVEACRYGEHEVRMGVLTQAAVVLDAVAPDVMAKLMEIAATLLPGPSGRQGDQIRRGWQSGTPLAPSLLTRLSDRAAMRNNEVPQPT